MRYVFDHDLSAPRGARRAVDDLLTDPDDVIAEDVRLTASELVTNTVLHTDSGGELRMWDPQPDVPLRLEVEDRDPTLPAIPVVEPETGGRGLIIVDAAAEEWGVEQLPEGKIVWAEFDRSRRADGH